MSALPATKAVSVEEYLLIEDTTEEKNEYFQGEIFAMAGGSIDHNTISVNVISEIRAFLKNKPCRIFNSDLKIQIEANSLFTYPDASIVCGDISFWQERTDTITNPSVIIEVLSPSTASYDRGQKFKLYRDIPFLKEYILISSTEVLIERYVKQSERAWKFTESKDANGFLQVETIDFSCPVSEIYRDVVFA